MEIKCQPGQCSAPNAPGHGARPDNPGPCCTVNLGNANASHLQKKCKAPQNTRPSLGKGQHKLC